MTNTDSGTGLECFFYSDNCKKPITIIFTHGRDFSITKRPRLNKNK